MDVGSGIETQIKNTKAYLLKANSHADTNLYEHFASMLSKLLEKRTRNVIDTFEDLSREEKRAEFKPSPDALQDQENETTLVTLAKTHSTLFVQKPLGNLPELSDENDEDIESPLPDIMELAHYFELGGIGISKEEIFRIFLALKQLVDSNPILTCRFWGKMFGLSNNYYVAEVEFREGEDPEERKFMKKTAEESDVVEEEHVVATVRSQDSLNVTENEDEPPKPDYKPPAPILEETYGTGCNKKVYFVCTEPGKPWVRLPLVTPAQIVVSRQIRKFFTGNLENEVVSYPPFPGKEASLLRATIARISASTIISPQGFYMFEEDDDEDEEARDSFVVNPEFEGLSISELIDPAFSNWVHHIQYILPQGRCTWHNPNQKGEEEEEEEEEDEEEREEPDEPEPEVGPPLLTPLSEDTEIDGFPAWTAVRAPSAIPQHSIAIVHSNLWPGAHCFAVERKYENVYVGWGQKYSSENYSPPPPPAPQDEYPSGPEVTEIDDPTVEEENALKAAQQEIAEDMEDDDDDEEDEEEDD